MTGKQLKALAAKVDDKAIVVSCGGVPVKAKVVKHGVVKDAYGDYKEAEKGDKQARPGVFISW
jgi:hypothetical protein